jgi:hypothetical protein
VVYAALQSEETRLQRGLARRIEHIACLRSEVSAHLFLSLNLRHEEAAHLLLTRNQRRHLSSQELIVACLHNEETSLTRLIAALQRVIVALQREET